MRDGCTVCVSQARRRRICAGQVQVRTQRRSADREVPRVCTSRRRGQSSGMPFPFHSIPFGWLAGRAVPPAATSGAPVRTSGPPTLPPMARDHGVRRAFCSVRLPWCMTGPTQPSITKSCGLAAGASLPVCVWVRLLHRVCQPRRDVVQGHTAATQPLPQPLACDPSEAHACMRIYVCK